MPGIRDWIALPSISVSVYSNCLPLSVMCCPTILFLLSMLSGWCCSREPTASCRVKSEKCDSNSLKETIACHHVFDCMTWSRTPVRCFVTTQNSDNLMSPDMYLTFSHLLIRYSASLDSTLSVECLNTSRKIHMFPEGKLFCCLLQNLLIRRSPIDSLQWNCGSLKSTKQEAGIKCHMKQYVVATNSSSWLNIWMWIARHLFSQTTIRFWFPRRLFCSLAYYACLWKDSIPLQQAICGIGSRYSLT